MNKKLICAVVLALSAFQVCAFQSTTKAKKVSINPAFNIANGLAPTEQQQKISVLEPFHGEFRILGSKEYLNDEQAKFRLTNMIVS